jgi:Cytochrome c biogenesis factor
MLAGVGSLILGLALATALYAAVAALLSLRRNDPRWAESARNGILSVAALLSLAFLLLLAAFLADRFEIRYVAEHSSRALPLYLKASALWAGQEGSLLLWSFLQALFAALALTSIPLPPSSSPALRERGRGKPPEAAGVGVRASAANSACRNDQRSRELSCLVNRAVAFRKGGRARVLCLAT